MNKYIRFQEAVLGNDTGDVARVVGETEGEYYYYDGLGRWCYLFKDDLGFEIIVANSKTEAEAQGSQPSTDCRECP